MIADWLSHLYLFWTRIKEYLPLLGPAIAISIFAYNQATRRRKHLQIEEFKGKGLSLKHIEWRLDYLRAIFKSRKIADLSFKWYGDDFSNVLVFEKDGDLPDDLKDTWSTSLVFQNSFTDEVTVSDYEQPFRIHFTTVGHAGYRIEAMTIVTVPANLHIQLYPKRDLVTGEPILEIAPVLLNPGDGFTLKLVSNRPLDYQLTYRIMGLKNNLLRKRLHLSWIFHNMFFLNLMLHICHISMFFILYVFFSHQNDKNIEIDTSVIKILGLVVGGVIGCLGVMRVWTMLFNSAEVVRREVMRGNVACIEALNEFLRLERFYEKL